MALAVVVVGGEEVEVAVAIRAAVAVAVAVAVATEEAATEEVATVGEDMAGELVAEVDINPALKSHAQTNPGLRFVHCGGAGRKHMLHERTSCVPCLLIVATGQNPRAGG